MVFNCLILAKWLGNKWLISTVLNAISNKCAIPAVNTTIRLEKHLCREDLTPASTLLFSNYFMSTHKHQTPSLHPKCALWLGSTGGPQSEQCVWSRRLHNVPKPCSGNPLGGSSQGPLCTSQKRCSSQGPSSAQGTSEQKCRCGLPWACEWRSVIHSGEMLKKHDTGTSKTSIKVTPGKPLSNPA